MILDIKVPKCSTGGTLLERVRMSQGESLTAAAAAICLSATHMHTQTHTQMGPQAAF